MSKKDSRSEGRLEMQSFSLSKDEFIVLYDPDRDVYRGAQSKRREPVPCVIAFTMPFAASCFLQALQEDRPEWARGLEIVKRTKAELIERSRRNGKFKGFMIMDNPLNIKYEWFPTR